MPTVLHRLSKWADSDPGAAAQRFKSGGQWQTLTAREYMDRVYHLALFLESRGIGPGDVGCVFAPNSPQWVHTDLAFLLLGSKSAGVYPNSTAKDVAYILSHTQAKVVAVKDKEFYTKVVGDAGEAGLPDTLKILICFEGDHSFAKRAISYDAAVTEGRKIAATRGAEGLAGLLKRLDAKAGSMLIYTSGTTGNPKGALLSHHNLVATSDLVSDFWRLPTARGSMFSFLPLCHVAEKLQCVGVGISRRFAVSFATKFENVAQELPEVQPTLLLCVPRLWEKMMEGVLHKVNRAPAARRKLAHWAFGVGARVAEARYSRRDPHVTDLLQWAVAKRLVIDKVKHAMGLGQAEIIASGAAALPVHVAKWFRCLGLEILEDFGQTESTGVICLTEPGVDSLGTVGRACPNVEVKIAEDGEITCRGPNVFVGYFKDDAATAATLVDGWLKTGDLAEKTPADLIRIRGRKKEVLKTSGGKMIAPLPIEEELKSEAIISQVCMVGDGRKYLSALVTLSEPALESLRKTPGLLDAITVKAPEVVDQVRAAVDKLNRSLASYEQIKRFAVLSREFSIADGEMTPTLKMKRNVIEDHFKEVIEGLYAG